MSGVSSFDSGDIGETLGEVDEVTFPFISEMNLSVEEVVEEQGLVADSIRSAGDDMFSILTALQTQFDL